MNAIVQRLRSGMAANGITGKAQDDIVQGITSFALYGFPESHAASFALIAYASAWLKVHHPTAFYLGILNAWPMAFYHPATLVKDAQRHGVEVRPVDVQTSGFRSHWEERHPLEGQRDPRTGTVPPAGAIRLGLRFVRGLRARAGQAIEKERRRAPFAGVE